MNDNIEYTPEIEDFIYPIDLNSVALTVETNGITVDGAFRTYEGIDGYFYEDSSIDLSIHINVDISGEIEMEAAGEPSKWIGSRILEKLGIEGDYDKAVEIAEAVIADVIEAIPYQLDIPKTDIFEAFESAHDQIEVFNNFGSDEYKFTFGGKEFARHTINCRNKEQLNAIWEEVETYVSNNEQTLFNVKLAELGLTKADLAHKLGYNPSSFYRLLNKQDAYIPTFVWLALDGLKYRSER